MTSSTPIPQASPAMPLAIVIPAFNEQDLIHRSLQASVDQTVPALEDALKGLVGPISPEHERM